MSKISIVILIIFSMFLTACSTRGKTTYLNRSTSAPKHYSSNPSDYSSKMGSKTYSHPTMKPYVVRGIRYHPTVVSVGDKFRGNASWYGPDFHGKLTSNGETYNMYDMTAAHKTLPMNTIVKVVNLNNGLSTVVRINDRGPFVATRIIDLSNTAAKKINMIGAGTAPVTIEVLGFQVKGAKQIPTKKEMQQTVVNSSDATFALQIGSFSNISGAIKTQEKYNNTDGYKTIIKDIGQDENRIFKVLLIGFQSEDEARDYKQNGKFQNSFIVRED